MSVRVLIVNPSPVRGGAEELLLALATRADAARAIFTFACLADGPFTDDLAATGAHVERVPAGRLRDPIRWARTVRRLAGLAREHDAVLSWQVKGHYYGTPAARIARVPAAWWDHGIRPASGEPRHLIDARLPAAVRADLVVCSSAAAASRHRRARVIHPGADLDAIGSDRPAARAALGVDDADEVVGIVGRLQPWKGQRVLVRATPAIVAARPHARVLVIGGTPGGFSADEPAALARLAGELGVADRVRLLGHRDDARALLAGLDVFVHASVDEPFGIVIVEAMAAGVPAVATRGGGVPEILDAPLEGLMVAPDDPEALASAVVETLSDELAARRRAEAARAKALDRFGIARYVRDVEDLAVDLAGRTA